MWSLLLLLLFSEAGSSLGGLPEVPVKLGAQAQFDAFVSTFGAVYTDESERDHRFKVFGANLLRIEAHREASGTTYTLGVNQFADLTQEEFLARLRYQKPEDVSEGLSPLVSTGDSPQSKDWEAEGSLTPIKDQGQCGSCWSFAVVAALEAATWIASGMLVSLSEQQLIDCTPNNHGCDRGAIEYAFTYTRNNDLCSEEEYAYVGRTGQCAPKDCVLNLPKGCQIGKLGYRRVGQNGATQRDMLAAVAQQPVAVAIAAGNLALYLGGIWQGSCGEDLNHAVVVVGYGIQDGVKYWKIRNSWHSGWGEMGYARFIRDDSAKGTCLMYQEASYPQMSHGCNPEGISLVTRLEVWLADRQHIALALLALLFCCCVASVFCRLCRNHCARKRAARQALLIDSPEVSVVDQTTIQDHLSPPFGSA